MPALRLRLKRIHCKIATVEEEIGAIVNQQSEHGLLAKGLSRPELGYTSTLAKPTGADFKCQQTKNTS